MSVSAHLAANTLRATVPAASTPEGDRYTRTLADALETALGRLPQG
jgi:hypothetical protein